MNTAKTTSNGKRLIRLIGGPADGEQRLVRHEQGSVGVTIAGVLHIYYKAANHARVYLHESAIGGAV